METIKNKTKSITTLFIIALVNLLFSNNILNGQCPDPPDCINEPFMYGGKTTINMNGCIIEYEFCYRYACDTYYDSYIYNYKVIYGDCSLLDPEQYENIVDACKADLVALKDPWGREPEWDINDVPPISYLNPIIPNCENGWSPIQWRFFSPTCMATYAYWDNEIGNIVSISVPCSATGLCVQTYRYCWREDDNGRRVLQNRKDPPYQFTTIRCDEAIIQEEVKIPCTFKGCSE